MSTLNLSYLEGPSGAEPGFMQSPTEFEQFYLFVF